MHHVLIVGQGIAGTVLARRLFLHGIPFKVVDFQRPVQASFVASGIYNPIVLKRMNPVWEASKMMNGLSFFYNDFQEFLDNNFHFQMPIIRVFSDIQEQNDWAVACDHPFMSRYLQKQMNQDFNTGLHTPYGVGVLNFCGRIDTYRMLTAFREWLKSNYLFFNEQFHHEDLISKGHQLYWKDQAFSHVVFCEGFQIVHNRLQNENEGFAFAKGEVIEIFCPDLDLSSIVNAGVFILPIGGGYYKVGATYAWNTLDETPTEAKQVFLKGQLEKVLTKPYQIVKHESGIRPTMKDRKPLVGPIAGKTSHFMLNGLGSRGVLMAPWLSDLLIQHMFVGQSIPAVLLPGRFN
jgi:glycine oxidase